MADAEDFVGDPVYVVTTGRLVWATNDERIAAEQYAATVAASNDHAARYRMERQAWHRVRAELRMIRGVKIHDLTGEDDE